MEMFNVHRRDILNFDKFIDIKKPSFGGPASAEPYKTANGKRANANPKLEGYQRMVKRDKLFSHPVYDSTYKAMTHDLVYKQEKGEVIDYDPYATALPVKVIKENRAIENFANFINEQDLGGTTEIRANNIETAEDVLFNQKIDWDNFTNAPDGVRGKGFSLNGELVAYYDEDRNKLVLLSSAKQMTDTAYNKMYGAEQESEDLEADDFEREHNDDGWRDDEKYNYGEEDDEVEYPEDQPTARKIEKPKTSIEDLEKMFKSFEDGAFEDENEEL
jgi:hypothetical protein